MLLQKGEPMISLKRNARVAGILYFLLALAGPVRIMYIPAKLFVHGNATATAANIAAHEGLFRFGIVTDLFAGAIVIFLALALYRLFREVDRGLAALMVVLGGVLPSAIYFFLVLNDVAAFTLVRGPDYLAAFSQAQRDALAMLFLNLHAQGFTAGEIFFGLWLLPLGLLTYRSRFLPRFLGVWLLINGFAYLALSFTGFVLPQYDKLVSNVLFPLLTGELAFMLWLLIVGAKPRVAAAGSAA
jgi:Domain of unknown function (DUF4386)